MGTTATLVFTAPGGIYHPSTNKGRHYLASEIGHGQNGLAINYMQRIYKDTVPCKDHLFILFLVSGIRARHT